jgi:hypothetical protein
MVVDDQTELTWTSGNGPEQSLAPGIPVGLR